MSTTSEKAGSKKGQIQMIAGTATLVVVMTIASFFVMVQPPTRFDELVQSRSSSPRLRQPASIAEVEETVSQNTQAREKNQAIDVPVPCEGDLTIDLPASVSQVRLTGTLCLQKNEIQSSEIRNELNGFSATVFYPKARAYTTDYITIASGKNAIKIVHQLAKGGREAREFIVNRE